MVKPSGGKMPRPRSAAGTKKLVILIRAYTGFELYVVDFDLGKEEDYSLINPRIQNRIPHPDSDPDWEFGHGFHEWEGCVVNSTLYMFQEFTSKWNFSEYELDTYFPDKKQVRKFDLLADDFLNSDKSALNSSEFLEPNEKSAIEQLQFEEMTPMNWLKCSPVAVPTPDGKIFVFDREIEAKRAHTCFELYDPIYNTWTPVKPPAFPKGTAERSFFEVRAYAFLDKTTFWLCTYNDSFSHQLECTLDLNPDKRKKKKKEKEKEKKMDDSLFSSLHSITVDAVTISPGVSYRHVSGAVSCFQLSPAPHRPIQMEMLSQPFITLLDHHHHHKADTLVSHLHYEQQPYQDNTGYLLIDAFHTRLDTQTPDTTLFATLKYKVDGARGLKSLYVFLV